MRRIVFAEKDRVELEEAEPEVMRPGSVRVRTALSLISAGTEGIALHRRFDDGTHWASYVRYPFRPGYAAIGIVQELGEGVDGLAIGDRVAFRSSHASEHVVDAGRCTPIPAEVELDAACWFALAKIAFIGARAAMYTLGDTVVVVGAGPIGQMSLRWAVAAGARSIIAVDAVSPRLEHARRGGASEVVAAAVGDAREAVVAACRGQLPRVVVDSTGNASAFSEALGLVADFGRVVLLGDTGSPASQHLTSDVVYRGVTIIGAHDSHNRRAPGWEDDTSLHELFFELVRTGRFDVRNLTTHHFAPADAKAAYQLATEEPGDSMGVVFDWMTT